MAKKARQNLVLLFVSPLLFLLARHSSPRCTTATRISSSRSRPLRIRLSLNGVRWLELRVRAHDRQVVARLDAAGEEARRIDAWLPVAVGTFSLSLSLSLSLSRYGLSSPSRRLTTSDRPQVTHFILAPDALKRVGTRVEQAASNNAHIVSEAWLEACLAAEERVDEGPYAVGSKVCWLRQGHPWSVDQADTRLLVSCVTATEREARSETCRYGARFDEVEEKEAFCWLTWLFALARIEAVVLWKSPEWLRWQHSAHEQQLGQRGAGFVAAAVAFVAVVVH